MDKHRIQTQLCSIGILIRFDRLEYTIMFGCSIAAVVCIPVSNYYDIKSLNTLIIMEYSRVQILHTICCRYASKMAITTQRPHYNSLNQAIQGN